LFFIIYFPSLNRFIFIAAIPLLGLEDGLGFVYYDRHGWTGTVHDASSYRLGPLPGLLCRGRVYQNHWKPSYALLDLGYIGMEWGITGHKRGRIPLRYDQKAFNSVVNSYRSPIENIFGRQKNCFNIMKGPFRGSIDDCDDIAWVTANLTNMDVSENPLRKYPSY